MRVNCPNLSAIASISHGFFTRESGVSEGLFHSLNCGFGSGDRADAVAQNRAFVCRTLGASALLTPYQTHSAKAVIVTEPWPEREPPEGDAIVTNVLGIAIGILTADCVPILLVDAKKGVIGAVHAGWKGAVGGIIEAGIAAMKSLGAKDITATIGPAIEQYSYEVGDAFREQFLKESPDNVRYFEPSSRDEHFMFAIKAYVAARLEKAGVTAVQTLENDTCLEETRFFSYRRACLRNESVYGRQVSAIMLHKPEKMVKKSFRNSIYVRRFLGIFARRTGVYKCT